jgi:hypothetical protein
MGYKILKLNNGEELIGSVVENETSLLIERPMVFISSTMSGNNGMAVDVTFLRDWLHNSDDKTIEIKKDRIVAIIEPSKKCSSIYDGEKEREDNEKKPVDESQMKTNIENMANEVGDFLDSFLNELNSDISQDYLHAVDEEMRNKRRKKRRKKKEVLKNPMIPDELKERPMLYLNMVIPPEAIMNLITSGILEPDMLLKMIDEIKKRNKFTGDEKGREDFGNQFSDWNPDPLSDDYS